MSLIHRNKNPYKSSNIYRVTASLTPDFPTLTPFEKVEKARKIVFTFDYPTPDNIDSDEFKKYFETMFITRYWERFFSAETFEAFTMRFYSKMLEIMPIYAELLSVFFMENKEKLYLNYTKSTSKTDSQNTGNENGKETKKGTTTGSSSSNDLGTAFPANMMSAGDHLDSVNYANNGTMNESSNSQTVNDNSTRENSRTEKGTVNTESETVSGVLLDGILKFNTEFKTVFTNMLNEFNPLFTALIDL